MAIKVNGTTVIDDSRNLSNVGGLKTVNGTSLVGSGNISAGASTSYEAVGTYVWAEINNNGVTQGSTYAGSGMSPAGIVSSAGDNPDDYDTNGITYGRDISISGTWRAMGRAMWATAYNRHRLTLFVRIS